MTLRPHPQRIASPAPRGSLLKHPRATMGQGRTRARVLDAGHLALVRQCPCLKCGLDPAGEAHHARAGLKRIGRRPQDEDAVPLCRSCHQLDPDSLHRVSEAAFWDAMGLSPLAVARKLAAAKGDLVAMRAICLLAIAGRK